MFRKTKIQGDLARFVIVLIFWQALSSSGYGQQPYLPAIPPQRTPLTSKFGPAANPLAHDVTNAGLATKKPAAHAGQPKPRLSPAAPITTIADPADGTDPFIVAEDQTLGNSATAIFAFVRDQVGFDVYAGSLRGARGTLWSNAGNSLDRASLLIALLRAAGFTAQYVQGTLSGAQAQQILQRMFANRPLGVIGCIPPATPLSDPVNNPALISTLQQHFWVQYASGGGSFQNADPTLSSAQLGQVFGTPQTTFTTVPNSLQNTVSIEMDAEIFNQAETLFGVGDGLSSTPVLNATFATSETAGRPLAIGHIVSSSTLGSIISAQTNTYTPYVTYGNSTDPTQDAIIMGTEYQEEFTNFPLGTTVVTGVFLTFTVTDSNGNTQTYNKTLFDRIGYAARQGGTSVSVTASPSGQTSISPADLTVVNVLASLQNNVQIQQYATTEAAIQSQLTPLVAAAANPSSPPTAAQSAAYAQLEPLGIDATMVGLRLTSTAFAALSDRIDAVTASANYVKAYFNSPRLIIATNRVTPATSGNTTTITQEIDLLKDDKFSIPLPGQNTAATVSYNLMRGAMESTVESQIMQALTQGYTPQNGVTLAATHSVADIFAVAQQQGIGMTLLTSSNAGQLNNLPISADAQARISNALTANLIVVAPSSPVTLGGGTTYGWYQIDPTTGATESVGEDGAHQGILEGVIADILSAETSIVVINCALFVLGFTFGLIFNLIYEIAEAFIKNLFPTTGPNSGVSFLQNVNNISFFLSDFPVAFILAPAFALGLAAAQALFLAIPSIDPPAPPILTPLPVPVAGAPGATPGVTGQLSVDPLLTIPFSGGQLPLAFRVQIQNTGPSADTFNLTPSGVPPGFTFSTSVPSMTIPAGATAIVGVCAVPSTPIAAPGTPESFAINVTSATNPSVTTSATENFTVPAIQGLTMSITPGATSVTPGTGVSATLTVQATGNTAVSAPLSATVPSPLSISGLPSSISLNAGQTQSIPLTITVPSGTAVGSQNVIQITAAVSGATTPTETSAFVNVVAAQAQAAVAAANNAEALGRTDIASTLSGLSSAINTAVSNCSPAAQQLVIDYVNNLIQEMNAPFLSNFAAQLQTVSSAIAAATCTNIGAALTQLSTVLASLSTVLTSPQAFPFNLALQPNSDVAQPNQASTFLVVLQNNSTTTNTYNLSLGSLPGGVTGSLSASSVTLAPGASIPVNNVMNNPSVTLTEPTSTGFQFSVSASINGLAGSTQTAFGTLTARSTFLAVQDVIATPGFTSAGGSVDVKTHIANVVNQNKTVQVTLVVNNSSNMQVLGPFTQMVPLSVSSLLTTVDFGMIATTGLANGNYTLAVSVIDPATSTVMPGGTGTGSLLIGSPVTATLAVVPQTVAPGNATVTSTLTVTGPASGGGSIIPIGSPLTFGGTNAPDTYTATTTFGPTHVMVDNGAMTIWQDQVPTGPNGEWDIFYMKTTNGGPLANNISGFWNVLMNYQLSAAVNFDQVVNQWLVNGTPVSPLTNGIGSICCATTSNPILPGAAYYGNGFTGALPAGTQTNWQQIFVTPYSLITNGGINPNTANEFIFALHFTRQAAVPVFNLIGSVATASAVASVAVNGNTVYTCDSNEVSVINAANPASPTITGTAFAGAINNATDIYCDIQRGDLVMLADTGNSGIGNNPSFLAFDLTNPVSPSLIASTAVNKRFFGAPFYQGNNAFFGTNVIFLSGSDITGQGGDFVSLDVTNFSAPAVLGTVEEPETNGPVYGGAFNVYGATPYSTTLAYATASTSQGSATATGTGQLWAINTANPSAMSIVTAVDVPGTIQLFSPLVQGNTAVAIGDTGGWRNPDVSADAFLGNVVVAVFDLTNPQIPQLVANVSTAFLPSPSFGHGAVVIGPNLFLYGGVMDASNNQLLLLVDTTNPQSPVTTTYTVPAAINGMRAVGTLLYASTSSGLQIYSIPGVGAVQYTATVQIANNANAAYNASSFSVTPTSITPGSGVDTVTWVSPPSNTITWTSNVTGIQAGQVLPIDLGGTINFTVPAGSGSVTLPQVNINSGQIVGLNPGTQTVAPGQLAAYTLIVNNPTSASVTYNLAVTGVSPGWVSLQASVTVPASGSVNVPLNLRSTLADLAGTYSFMVTATSGGASGSVEGTMVLAGTGSIGPLSSTNALGASVLLTPTQQTGGQGTPATFTVQVTNAGNVADTYTLSAATPAGVTATFDRSSLAIQPGLSNFQQTLLHLTAAPGTPAGALNFTVTATSQANSQAQNSAAGILNLVSTGVSVSLSPASVSPGGSFQLTVRNIGQSSGTFAIALGGPAAVIANLATPSVTLNAGQSQTLSVAIGAASFAALGSLGLVATVTSNGVTGAASGTVIVPSSKQVSAAFNPARTALNAPGPATLLLQIQNTGTTQDSYTATIESTSGPIAQVSIIDITGLNVQTTSPFILPGVTSGELAVNATLTGNSSGTVTVKITSQSDPTITATATGILGIGADMPVAIAGKNRNVPTGKYISLDGGQSFDPGKSELSYAWTIVSKPAGSVLAVLHGAAAPQPDFLPDVNGSYTLQLIVNNGTQSSAPSTVQITAYANSIPPNANAGAAVNVPRSRPVTLNGALSSDPSQSNATLSYQWTVQSAPAGSTLAGAQLAATATPSFTPDLDGAYVIQLMVTDLFGSNTDTVIITAYDDPNSSNVPPNAVAGPNRRIVIDTPITVDGSGSNDPDNSPQPLTYQWSFVSGVLPGSSLVNANASKVTFTPPMAGFYVSRLDINDGAAGAFAETTVMAANFCDANADGVVNQVDFDLMTALIGTTAQVNDPLDVNDDGLITAADISLCQGKAGLSGGSVTLSLAPPYLSFSYTIGAALPPAQSFGVNSNGPPLSALLWSPNAPWVQVTPSSGTTPFSPKVSINPTGLAPGGYQGLVYAASSGANNVPQMVVTLQVYGTPQFILTPPSLNFTYQIGQPAPPAQTVDVATSNKIVNFTSAVTAGASWLQVQPSGGQTALPITVTVFPQNLAPGTYTGAITLASTEAPSANVPVTLVVTPAPPTITASGVVNAASLLSGAIAPGEMLIINGTGFTAPGPAISAPSGVTLPTELATTQVFFNNVPAPMSSLQADQVSVVVPYEIQGQPTVLLKVVYAGTASSTINLIVAATAPGIFTTPSIGTGQMAAVNVDGTLNSSGNPAARGSVITFYATGGGQTNPLGIDGAIAGKTPPVPAALVSLTIGGVPAQVTYAGGAPGYPAGLMQINAVIPSTIPPNVATQVVLTIGSANSQPGTTIALH